MKNSDDKILAKIKQLFDNLPASELEARPNLKILQNELSALYSQLSFDRPYTPQELFPKIGDDCQITDDIIKRAEQLSHEAHQPWHGSSTIQENGRNYESIRESFKKQTGIDVGRKYTYPNNISPQEFQETFSATQLCKDITSELKGMALYSLVMAYSPTFFKDYALSCKLFLEKEMSERTALLKNAYRQFWAANPQIAGYEDLKKINNLEEMREFLMGVASEIPLDDVSLYLRSEYHNDVDAGNQMHKNFAKLKEAFGGDVGFKMSDKTWDKHVKPFLDQRKKSSTGLLKGIKKIKETQQKRADGQKSSTKKTARRPCVEPNGM